MKKTIIMAALGLAASAVSSYGQGSVIFSSYSANGTAGVATYLGLGGSTTTIPSSFHADLYAVAGAFSDPVNTSVSTSITALPAAGLTDLGILGVTYSQSYNGLNYFNSGPVATPTPTGAGITFEVVAFNGSSYANSTVRGRSGSFTMASLNAAPAPLNHLGDNGQPFPVMYVTSVPEPTTLALAGLGGLASLVALRREEPQRA